jgi:hypothetical protein
MKTLLPTRNSAALLACLAMLCHQVSAETFVVDPARAAFTLSGSVANNPIQEQSTGSLTSMFDGTLAVDRGKRARCRSPEAASCSFALMGPGNRAPLGWRGALLLILAPRRQTPFLGPPKPPFAIFDWTSQVADVQFSGGSFCCRWTGRSNSSRCRRQRLPLLSTTR